MSEHLNRKVGKGLLTRLIAPVKASLLIIKPPSCLIAPAALYHVTVRKGGPILYHLKHHALSTADQVSCILGQKNHLFLLIITLDRMMQC